MKKRSPIVIGSIFLLEGGEEQPAVYGTKEYDDLLKQCSAARPYYGAEDQLPWPWPKSPSHSNHGTQTGRISPRDISHAPIASGLLLDEWIGQFSTKWRQS